MKWSKSLLVFLFLSLSILPYSYGQYDDYRVQLNAAADVDYATVSSPVQNDSKLHLSPGIGLFILVTDDIKIGTGLGITKRTYYDEDKYPKYQPSYYSGASPQYKQDVTFLSVPLYFNRLLFDENKVTGWFTLGLLNNIAISRYNTWTNLNNTLDMNYYQNGVVNKSSPYKRPQINNYNPFFQIGYLMDFDINDRTYFSINPNIQYASLLTLNNLLTDFSFGVQVRLGIRLGLIGQVKNKEGKIDVIKVKLPK